MDPALLIDDPPPPRRPTLRQELASLPRAYWALFAGIFINRFGSFVYPFLTITLTRRGFENWEIGIALGGYGIGTVLSTFYSGWYADRFGRRITIITGAFMHASSILMMAWAQSLPALLCLTAAAGFSGGFFGPAGNALVADVTPEHLRLRAYAGIRLAANAGFAFGVLVGGLLVEYAPFWLFIGDALTTAGYGLVAIFLLPTGVRVSKKEARWSEAWAVLKKDNAFWALFAAQVCISVVFTQFSTTYSKDITQRHMDVSIFGFQLTNNQIFSILVGWNGAMVMLLEMASTRFTQRFNPRIVMTIGNLLLGFGFAFNGIAQGLGQLFLGMTLFTLGEMLSIPLVNATVSELAPEKMRGRYQGMLSLSWALGALVGPQIGFALYGWNPAILWSFCGLLGCVAAAVQWRSRRHAHKPLPSSITKPAAPASTTPAPVLQADGVE